MDAETRIIVAADLTNQVADGVKHSGWRAQKAPRGCIPIGATPNDRMRPKLRTKRGQARYKLRQTSVEPVFGHIKEPMRFRQVPLRGQDKARAMWRLRVRRSTGEAP